MRSRWDVPSPDARAICAVAAVVRRGLYTAAMPLHFQFNTFIGTLCVTRDTDVHKLAPKLDIDPMELLKMINGQVTPTKSIVTGLAKELGCDPAYLQKLAAEIKS
jgi:hypothetical protein